MLDTTNIAALLGRADAPLRAGVGSPYVLVSPMESQPRRIDHERWLGLFILFLGVPASFGVALSIYMWGQWRMPMEDDMLLVPPLLLILLVLLSTILAVITARAPSPLGTWLHARLTALPDGVKRTIWLLSTITGAILLFVLLCGPWAVARRLATSLGSRGLVWRVPVVIALIPLTLAIGSITPPVAWFKVWWPWSAYRPQIQRLLADADAAADGLGLPRDRKLTPAELAAWAQAAPLALNLELPLVHRKAHITVVYPTGSRMAPGKVWAYWGYPDQVTFGPMIVKTMCIEWADD
jgi:hypothetical protein